MMMMMMMMMIIIIIIIMQDKLSRTSRNETVVKPDILLEQLRLVKSVPYVTLHIKGTSIPALGIAGAINNLRKQTNLYAAQTSNEV